MKKIKLEELVKPEIRREIPIKGKDVSIIIKNLTQSQAEELEKLLQNSKDDNLEEIFSFMIKNLTNIDPSLTFSILSNKNVVPEAEELAVELLDMISEVAISIANKGKVLVKGREVEKAFKGLQ